MHKQVQKPRLGFNCILLFQGFKRRETGEASFDLPLPLFALALLFLWFEFTSVELASSWLLNLMEWETHTLFRVRVRRSVQRSRVNKLLFFQSEYDLGLIYRIFQRTIKVLFRLGIFWLVEIHTLRNWTAWKYLSECSLRISECYELFYSSEPFLLRLHWQFTFACLLSATRLTAARFQAAYPVRVWWSRTQTSRRDGPKD